VSLRVRARELEQIHAHLTRVYPEEGCGVMLGRESGDAREVERVMAFENRREDSRHNRYTISPEQFLQAERAGREGGLDVLGFFHSHPDHPPRPSAFDLENAWPYYSYMIVSVARGTVTETRAWRLADDRSRFVEETLEPLPGAGPAPGAAPRDTR
jgi:proteasome lid subunit RPN8/RPN11